MRGDLILWDRDGKNNGDVIPRIYALVPETAQVSYCKCQKDWWPVMEKNSCATQHNGFNYNFQIYISRYLVVFLHEDRWGGHVQQ